MEVKPTFPGEINEFHAYIANNYKAPGKQGLSGKVFFSFVIEKDRTFTDLKKIGDLGFETGEEAICVLFKGPKRTPGMQKDKLICPVTEEFLGHTYSFPIKTQNLGELKELLYNKHKIEIPVIKSD